MKKILLFTAGLYITQLLTAQTPVAYYAFNGNANDGSGNNLHGTIIGLPVFTADRFGNANSAIAFDGNAANRIEVADNALLRLPNVSITAWVKLNNASGIQTFVDKPLSPCTADSWHFGTEDNNFSAWLFRTTGCNDKVQATSPLAVNIWAYVAMTADATNQQLKLYINGSLVSTAAYAGTISYDANPMMLGAALENNSIAFGMNGILDEVKIYGEVLTAAEIEKEYSPDAPVPVAQYSFNGHADDISGNNLDGTIIGSPSFTTDRLGNANSAIAFDGNTANRVEVADNDLLHPASVTIAAWVKLNTASGINTFVDKPLSPCFNDSWHFGTEGGNFSTWVSRTSGCGDYSQVTSAVSLNTWVHMAATADPVSHQLKLYLNGVLANTSSYSGAIPYDNNVMLFGAALENDNLAFPLNGALDDVKIFNTALTATQVLGVFSGEEFCNGYDDDGDGLIDETCIPNASMGDATINEGNTGTQEMRFTLSLDHPYQDVVQVRYTTADSTARRNTDYVKKQGIINFQPGQVSKRIAVTINGDSTVEANEFLKVLAGQATNAKMLDSVGVGRIRNDDVAAAVLSSGSDEAKSISVKLSPNPARDMISLSGLQPVNTTIQIADIQGRIVLQQRCSGNTVSINIAQLNPGMYLLKYTDGQTIKSIKFVKE